MKLHVDDYLKLVAPNGEYRYGFVTRTEDAGRVVRIDLHEEGATKIAYDAAEDRCHGRAPVDWDKDLTIREKKLIPLLAAGLSTREISRILLISPVTTRFHIRNLRMKLRLDDRNQLIAYSQGLVSLLTLEQDVSVVPA